MRKPLLAFLFTALPAAGFAGEADVVNATAVQTSPDVWRISATVRHNDEGWDHYADRWDVVDSEGTVIATRILAHPHETEQPFTRSLSNIEIDSAIHVVTIRARDSVHGYGGKTFVLMLKR